MKKLPKPKPRPALAWDEHVRKIRAQDKKMPKEIRDVLK